MQIIRFLGKKVNIPEKRLKIPEKCPKQRNKALKMSIFKILKNAYELDFILSQGPTIQKRSMTKNVDRLLSPTPACYKYIRTWPLIVLIFELWLYILI